MKTTKEMIRVMQAYKRGRQIQYYSSIMHQWADTINPIWNWADFDYRIKPKTKFAPFETAEEFLKAQSIHGREIIVFNEPYTNSYVDYNGNVFLNKRSSIYTYNWSFTLKELFEKCKFSDNTPCGKEIIE